MKAPKENISRRLKIIKGQLNGLEKMVGEDKYCVDILTLSLAIQRAMKEMDQLVMEGHMKTCVQNGISDGKPEKVTKELMDLFAVIRK